MNGAAEFIPTLGTLAVFNSHPFAPNTYPDGTNQYLVSKYNIQLASKAGLSSSDLIQYMGGNPLNDWAPRVALAYKVTDKTVVRSGFGVYYQVWNTGFNSGSYIGQMPFFAVYTYTNTAVPSVATGGTPAPLTPAISMNAPFQATGTVPANPTASLCGKPKTPYTLNWNLTVERELLPRRHPARGVCWVSKQQDVWQPGHQWAYAITGRQPANSAAMEYTLWL